MIANNSQGLAPYLTRIISKNLVAEVVGLSADGQEAVLEVSKDGVRKDRGREVRKLPISQLGGLTLQVGTRIKLKAELFLIPQEPRDPAAHLKNLRIKAAAISRFDRLATPDCAITYMQDLTNFGYAREEAFETRPGGTPSQFMQPSVAHTVVMTGLVALLESWDRSQHRAASRALNWEIVEKSDIRLLAFLAQAKHPRQQLVLLDQLTRFPQKPTNESFIGPITALLQAQDPYVRLFAARCIRARGLHAGYPAVREALARAIERAPRSQEAAAAALALEEYGLASRNPFGGVENQYFRNLPGRWRKLEERLAKRGRKLTEDGFPAGRVYWS